MRINLPETLEMETPYGRATLTRSRRLCHGRNDLSDIKWYTYTITIENHAELDLAYDCIAVSFAKITEEILKTCREELPDYMVPDEIEYRSELPRTPRGKIDYRALEDTAKEA